MGEFFQVAAPGGDARQLDELRGGVLRRPKIASGGQEADAVADGAVNVADRRIGTGNRLLLGCDGRAEVRPGAAPAGARGQHHQRGEGAGVARRAAQERREVGKLQGYLGGGDLRQAPAVAVDQRDERHAAHCDGVGRLDRTVDVAGHRDRDHPVAVAQRSRRKQEIEGADGPPVEAVALRQSPRRLRCEQAVAAAHDEKPASLSGRHVPRTGADEFGRAHREMRQSQGLPLDVPAHARGIIHAGRRHP